jgi:hypothetical protein
MYEIQSLYPIAREQTAFFAAQNVTGAKDLQDVGELLEFGGHFKQGQVVSRPDL